MITCEERKATTPLFDVQIVSKWLDKQYEKIDRRRETLDRIRNNVMAEAQRQRASA